MTRLAITYRLLSELKPSPNNARTHSRRQVEQVAKSIEAFSFNEPILIDGSDTIVAGHCRAVAAELLNMATVPTVCVDHLSEAQKRAYMIASNRLAELAGWDEDMLALELGDLSGLELNFDLTAIGFETAELDMMIGDTEQPSRDDPDDDLPLPGPLVNKLNDLWQIGSHRLLCGDATKRQSYEQLMQGELAQQIVSDVPYNVKIANNVSGLGKVKHGEFIQASGEMSEAEFTRFLTSSFRLMADFSVDGSLHFIFMDWRHLYELLRAGRIAYDALVNMIIWAKSAGGMGSLYRSQHEHIAVFRNGSGKSINNVALGKFGRNRTNVWNYAGLNSFQADRAELLAMHATVKPVTMIADAILDCSHRGGIILDPFVGSGTAILAAERTVRRCYAIELDPQFADVALRRIRNAHGLEPVHVATRKTFTEIEREATINAGVVAPLVTEAA